MLNANYISLFGMQRVDVMIRQKFLNDLKDLQEINDCFRKESNHQRVQENADSSSSICILKPSNKKSTKPAKLNQSKASSPNKNSKKEDPKNNLEKKTNANVYFWYYKDEPGQQQQQKQKQKQSIKKQKPLKLPALNTQNPRKRKNSITNTELPNVLAVESIENLPKLIEKDDKSAYLNEEDEIGENLVSKKIEQRQPSAETVYSVDDNDIDFEFSLQSKRRIILKTAQLKQLNLSPKFIEEAKKMVFIPSCKSFHPIEVSKYVRESVK